MFFGIKSHRFTALAGININKNYGQSEIQERIVFFFCAKPLTPSGFECLVVYRAVLIVAKQYKMTINL